MGIAELDTARSLLTIHSRFFFYGSGSSQWLAERIAADIAGHWNEAAATAVIRRRLFGVRFVIEGFHAPELAPETVWQNDDPRNNYFRIEGFSHHHVSFVDGINCNTGYFKLDNLQDHSTTAAHEYGHTLGLDHPRNLDIRGQGQPGIMYPRGTVCDPGYQYDPAALPLAAGGTINPFLRKVLAADIAQLKLGSRRWRDGTTVIGDFSSVYHEKHGEGQ